MADQYTLTAEQDQELEAMVLEMEADGLSEDDISTVVTNYFEEAEANAGKTQELETEDATSVQDSGASSLEEYGSELPTLEEVEIDRHNKRQEKLAKGISAATNVPEFLVDDVAAIAKGFVDLGSGVVNFLGGLDIALRETFRPEFAEELKNNPELKAEYLAKVTGNFGEETSEKFSAFTRRSDAGITELFMRGDIAEGLQQTGQQVAGAIPSVVVTMSGAGGLAVLGTSAAGSSIEEDFEQHPEEATWKMVGTGVLKGGYEMLSEMATRGILKRAGLMFGQGAPRDQVQKTVMEQFKQVFKDANIEGVSEGLADLAGKITDSVAYGEEIDPRQAFLEFVDTYIIGGIVGGGASVVGNANNRSIVKDYVEPDSKKEADNQSAAVMNTLADARRSASPEELSLMNEIFNKEQEAINQREKEHQRTVNDMTQEEAVEVTKNTQESKRWTQAASDPNITPELTYIYEEKAAESKEKAEATYEMVYEWPQTVQRAEEIKEEIKEKKDEIKQKRKTLAKSENPNPASTDKLNKEEAELNEKEEGLDDALTEMRPTHAESKVKKAKKAKKAKKVEETTEVKKEPVQERAETSEEALSTITDPNIPDGQKERSWKTFFKTNKKTIDNLAYKSERKYGRGKGKEAVQAAIKQEVFDRLTTDKTETGRARKAKYDLTDPASRAKFWNAVDQAVNRKFQDETDTDQKITDPEYIEEKAYFDELLADEVINQDDYNTEVRNLKAKYGAKLGKISVDYTDSEGAQAINPHVEKAYRDAQEDSGVDNTKAISEALEGTSVDKLFKDWRNNTEKLFKLMPPEFHSKPEFQNGNPPVEIWEQYFSDDAAGRKRKSRMKSKVNEWIADNFGDGVDSEKIEGDDIMDGAFDFLEDGKKASVKKFLPLLAQLKRNFPGAKIVISKAKMIEDFIAAGIDPGKADQVKGYTDGSVVVLNPDKLDLETPIHEFGHIWAQATRTGRPDLYAKAEKLIKTSIYYAKVKQASQDPDSVYYGFSEARLVEEAIAQGIGLAGADLYTQAPQQSAWDTLRKQIWDWINAQVGFGSIENLTLDQFLKLAVTEIITGEQFVKPADFETISNPDSALNYKEMRPGTTVSHGMPTAPVVELDYHGVRKTAKMVQELGKNVNKYYEDLKNGEWILWQTGKFGEASKAAGKYDAKLSAIAEAKFKAAQEYLSHEGLRLKAVPGGAHAFAIVPKLSFLEDSPAADKGKVLKGLLNKSYTYKEASPYKKSKIDQKTRETIEATKRDFALRGHLLSESQIDELILELQNVVQNGRDTQIEKKKELSKARDEVKNEAGNLVKETSGINPETITQSAIDAKSNEKRNFISDLKKGNFVSALSRALSPDSNNDFYGLLYNLLPSGKGRAKAKQFIKDALTDPLEDANYNQLESAKAVRENYRGLREKHGISDKDISRPSGISVDGIELTNSQVVKLYNYIKNPKLYKQLAEGGVDTKKMEEILDYLDTKPNLKSFANEVPSIFAGSKQFLNQKLDEHTYKGVSDPTIVKPGPGAELDILARVYEGNIPQTAPYTPFTAVGADTSLDIDKVFEGDGDFYSVMSGNLKERTGGGAVRLFGESLEKDITTYIEGPLRTANYLDFARSASDVFSSKNIKAMDAAYGKEWGRSARESLKAIITGKNRPVVQTKGQRAIINWMNRSVAGIMFLNVRSGVLQMISTGNFAVENPGAFAKGLSDPKAVKEAAKLIWDSAWFEERGKGKTGIEFEEVFGQQSTTAAGRATDQILQWGYAVTKVGDKGAILMGGAPYVAGRIKQGVSKEEALKEFIAMAEETQQSSRPERIGREQRSPFGRAILAFANTPMQYNRKMQKAFKDMTAKEATLKERGAAANKILYYGAVQNVIFTALQQAVFAGLDLDDEEKTNKKLESALNSILDTILRGSGIIGASVAVVKNILVAVNNQPRADQKAKVALKKGLGISPALSSKAYQLEKALVESQYPLSDGPVTVPSAVSRSANAVQFITNVPLTRAIKKFEGMNDLGADDLTNFEKTLRVAGWDRYALDKSVKKDEVEYVNPYE